MNVITLNERNNRIARIDNSFGKKRLDLGDFDRNSRLPLAFLNNLPPQTAHSCFQRNPSQGALLNFWSHSMGVLAGNYGGKLQWAPFLSVLLMKLIILNLLTFHEGAHRNPNLQTSSSR